MRGTFETELGLYSADEHRVDAAEWQAASEDDRFFSYGRLVRTPPEFQFSPNSLAYLRFRNAFQTDDNLRAFFEEATRSSSPEATTSVAIRWVWATS